MKGYKKIPELVRSTIEKNEIHVFFVSNPVVSILARMVIDEYDLDPNNIICVSIRNSNTELVCNESIQPYSRWYDRAIVKLFLVSPQGRRIVRQLEERKKNFIVYASWMYPEIERVTASSYCQGHIYLEEGQQSYYQSKPYAFLGNYKSRRRREIKKGNINYYFREDSSAYIGLSKESFPIVEEDKRFILNNLASIHQFYRPRLVGVKFIGLMPAPHRIPQKYLESALILLISKMPDGGVIKLHPGFNVHTILRDYISSILDRISNGTVTICDDDVILELEMLSEPKFFIGIRSSVSRYAEALGSKYEFVHFDGYLPPKN